MLTNFIGVNLKHEEVDIENNSVALSEKPAKLLNMFNSESALACISKSVSDKTVTLNATDLNKINVTYIF